MGAAGHPSLQSLDYIEDLLEAYADARLAPPGPVLDRMRRTVLEQAAATAATRAAERAARAGADAPRDPLWWLPRLRLPRPAFAAGFAAMLTLVTGAAVLAAPPGSPFFNARIAIEQTFMPPVAQPDARLAAREDHLEDRLAEAQAAAARGDIVGLNAALMAYDEEVTIAVAEASTDPTRLAHLEAMLAKHVVVLTALLDKVPDNAGIENALANSQKAIAKIKAKWADGKPGNGPGSNSGNGPGSNSGNGPGSNSGNGPGSNSGNGPGSNSGSDPGSNSGKTPAPSVGTAPEPTPDTVLPTPVSDRDDEHRDDDVSSGDGDSHADEGDDDSD